VTVELCGLLSDPFHQSLQVCPVVELHKQLHEKAGIASRIDEVPSRSLMFRFPHLHGHRLCEHLLSQFVFGTHCCSDVRRCLVIDNMRGLVVVLASDRIAGGMTTYPGSHTMMPASLVRVPEGFEDLQDVRFPCVLLRRWRNFARIVRCLQNVTGCLWL